MMQLQTFQVNHVFSIAKGLHIFSLLQSMFSSVVHLVLLFIVSNCASTWMLSAIQQGCKFGLCAQACHSPWDIFHTSLTFSFYLSLCFQLFGHQ